jgi:uncharacterized protein YqhQ
MPSEAYALNPDMLVGGQAVLGGVMMRSTRGYAVAVRRPDGTLAFDRDSVPAPSRRFPILRFPVLRGSTVLIQSLLLGFRALSFAARESLPASEKPEEFGGKAAVTGSLIAAALFAAGLFIFLPLLATNLLKSTFLPGMGPLLYNGVDGLVRILLFFGYLWAISRLPDIQRVFEYHGAEHKVVFTFEAGEDLTVENAREKSRLHPRCGTSFLLFVLVLSIGVFALIPASSPFLVKFLSRLLFIPLIAGLAYETIRFSSRRVDNPILRLVIAPGLWLQRITTREPSDDQLEVALAALKEALTFDLASPSPQAAVL